MSNRSHQIRVGIVGASPVRSWAALAHIPALQQLPAYRLAALSTTNMKSARAAGEAFGVRHVYDNHDELIADPDVDLVVVAVKVPHHLQIVSAALEAGKHVYCEWPLGNGLGEAEELATLARRMKVRTAIGLQARAAPAVRYLRDLIADGYVGEVLSVTVIGSGMNWGSIIDAGNAYSADIANGATMLTIAFGHTVDAVCYCLGQEPREVSAELRQRRKYITVAETGEQRPLTAHDQVLVSAVLENGAPLSVHYRGGTSRGINLLWEINGTRGDVQVTASTGLAQMAELNIAAGNTTDMGLTRLQIPERYLDGLSPPPGYAAGLLYAYARLARDLQDGTSLCPDFQEAIKRHRLIAAIERSASQGIRQRLR
jgi:predicted dehydrogenase